ncbi:MAG: hypothetical protein Q7V17_07065 [Afipia sp.]|nr:hypothetical protein [Afipia sp.]
MSEDSLPGSEIFGQAYKDWQAIRIIRDNYFDIWKTFLTFYSWFGATMVGVGGYIISNRPFTISDSHIIGWIGVALIVNVLLILIFIAFILRRYIRNLHSILERGGDLHFMQDKLLNTRTANMVAASCACGLTVGLFAWIYVIFFHYVSHG